MPDEFARRVGVFARQGVRQPDFPEAVLKVGLMDLPNRLNLTLERRYERVGHDGDAVVFAFSVADDDLTISEIDIFDAEAETFHQAKSRAIEDLRHEFGDAGHAVDDGERLRAREDDGERFGFFGADNGGGDFNFPLENVAVEEKDGGERLILSGGGDVLFNREVGNERLNFRRAHFEGVAFVVKQDVAFYPVFVSLFGAVRIMFGSNRVANFVE